MVVTSDPYYSFIKRWHNHRRKSIKLSKSIISRNGVKQKLTDCSVHKINVAICDVGYSEEVTFDDGVAEGVDREVPRGGCVTHDCI